MESILPSAELVILWRLSGRWEEIGELSARWEVKYQLTRPRAYQLIVHRALMELEEHLPAGELNREELLVLLRSENPRVRMLAMRLFAPPAAG